MRLDGKAIVRPAFNSSHTESFQRILLHEKSWGGGGPEMRLVPPSADNCKRRSKTQAQNLCSGLDLNIYGHHV